MHVNFKRNGKICRMHHAFFQDLPHFLFLFLPCLDQKFVVETFGKEILNPDGTIDRKILGRIVFDQPEKLQKLNAIVHPAVNEKIREEMQKAQEEGKELFILEAALLTEPVYREMLDEIWYIHVPQEIRMERLRSSRGYSDEKMYAVFANQPSEETFTAVSDLVIENGGTFEETEKQIDLALGRG